MSEIINALNENLKVIYRKALDADQSLNALQSQGKGKFKTIFDTDSGFTTNSKRFAPYVEEVAEQVMNLNNASEDDLANKLPQLVKKIELLFKTLEQFKRTI